MLKSLPVYEPVFLLTLLLRLADPPLVPPTGTVWQDEIVVTANRREGALQETAAHVIILGREEIDQSASLAVDDVLRQVPGFSLFRRSSGLAAHPTSQGVSLRGIGPSGASRTLVLLDGVPLNDPFGGWVQWARVLQESLDRVEIVRGGGSDLWGSSALGGVIQLLTAPPRERSLSGTLEGGDHDQLRAGLEASRRIGPAGISVDLSRLEGGGYPVIREDQQRALPSLPGAQRRHGRQLRPRAGGPDRCRARPRPRDGPLQFSAHRLLEPGGGCRLQRDPRPRAGDHPALRFRPRGGRLRHRQNLEEVRIHGLEAEAAHRPTPFWRISASYLLSRPEIRKSPRDPGLEGNRLAQVPEHQIVARVAYANLDRLAGSFQLRYGSEQFKDDLNTLTLDDSLVADLTLRRRLPPGFELFVGVENLLDETVETGRTADGVVSVGAPRLIHGGVRFQLGDS